MSQRSLRLPRVQTPRGLSPTRAAPPLRPIPPGCARGPDRVKLEALAAASALWVSPLTRVPRAAPPTPRPLRDAPAPIAARSAQAPPRGSGRRRDRPRLETEAKAAAAAKEEERRGWRRRRWRRGAHEAAADGTGRGPAEEAAPGDPPAR